MDAGKRTRWRLPRASNAADWSVHGWTIAAPMETSMFRRNWGNQHLSLVISNERPLMDICGRLVGPVISEKFWPSRILPWKIAIKINTRNLDLLHDPHFSFLLDDALRIVRPDFKSSLLGSFIFPPKAEILDSKSFRQTTMSDWYPKRAIRLSLAPTRSALSSTTADQGKARKSNSSTEGAYRTYSATESKHWHRPYTMSRK